MRFLADTQVLVWYVTDPEQFTAILAVLHDPESPFEVLSVDLAVGEQVRHVPRIVNADPGDRIIVATAEVHGLAVISSDSEVAEMTGQKIIC